MRPEQDAYGKILEDIHTETNPQAGEIIERDDGYIEHTGPATTYFKPYDEWLPQVQKAITHAHGNTIDIGCGAGRHTLYLQENTQATPRAIDVSPKAIQVTNNRGAKRTSTAHFDDITTLPEAPYDTVLLLGNNLGLLGSQPIKRLNKLAEATTENATIIGQTREATKTNNPAHTQYHEYNKARDRRPGCIRLRIRYKHFKTPWYDYLYINYNELKSLLKQTPWEIKQRYQETNESIYTVILEKEQ